MGKNKWKKFKKHYKNKLYYVRSTVIQDSIHSEYEYMIYLDKNYENLYTIAYGDKRNIKKAIEEEHKKELETVNQFEVMGTVHDILNMIKERGDLKIKTDYTNEKYYHFENPNVKLSKIKIKGKWKITLEVIVEEQKREM